MQVIQQPLSLFAYELERNQSQRMLELAIRSETPVTLSFQGGGGSSAEARFSEGTSESLWLVAERAPLEWGEHLQSAYCEVRFELGDTRYLLITDVLAVVAEATGCRMEIVRPPTVQVLQRRRFWRAQLQDSSTVRLCRTESAEGDSGLGEASLLNVSSDGLACLADRSVADRAEIGQRIGLEFRVGRDDEPLALDGVLKSKTIAGSDGRLVLGFQFELRPESSQGQRLRDALGRLA